jgi:hypothetical protein
VSLALWFFFEIIVGTNEVQPACLNGARRIESGHLFGVASPQVMSAFKRVRKMSDMVAQSPAALRVLLRWPNTSRRVGRRWTIQRESVGMSSGRHRPHSCASAE